MASLNPLMVALVLVAICLSPTLGLSKTHHHQFIVQETTVKRLCERKTIITVNGMLPGPTLEVRNGDGLVIEVVNQSPYNVTIHWHGIRQRRTAWADGPEFVTQCPIGPRGSYTYRFTIEDQEGTLWWHAHSSWLRATVYGALIIRPRQDAIYPFPKPRCETPIILGEWWNANPLDVLRQSTHTGGPPNVSDAFTINGQPGDLYKCSSKDTTKVHVGLGELILLRVINAAMNAELFVSIAGHFMTVVGVDASYTKPFTTAFLMLGPGQTTDVLVAANEVPGRYYIAARAYASAQGVAFDNTTTTAILEYKNIPCPAKGSLISAPMMPLLPVYNDTFAATAFAAGLKYLLHAKIPKHVDQNLFFTVGLGTLPCGSGQQCQGPNGMRLSASMNNVSFVLPSRNSILQAHYFGNNGVFTEDFPAVPPVTFDYTAQNISQSLWQPRRGTRVYKIKYGSVVQVVLQGTNIVTGENHPMHIHGYDFWVLAQGFGNYNPEVDIHKFNLIDPPMRNTIGVPVNGWAVIRFVADNPGVWLMHCHLDVHITWGLAMVFLVENGIGKLQTLEPPPIDLPMC